MLLTDHKKSCMKIYLHQYFEQCYDTCLIVDEQWNDRVKIRFDIDKIDCLDENSCTNDCLKLIHSIILLTHDNRDTGVYE
jgi:hypothetical protein